MRVAVYGSSDWDNYSDLVRQVTLFIQEAVELEHEGITFVHTGKKGAENMITEYIGKTEKFLRQKKFKIKEELFRDKNKLADVKIAESGIDYAIIFSTRDKRTQICKQILGAYEIPFRLVEKD
jgi:hypothetical protein